MSHSQLRTLIVERLIFVKIATACLWGFWLISIGLSGFRNDIKGDPIGTDHIAFYSAARLITEGRGTEVYDYAFLGNYQSELLGWGGGLDAYRNPPFYALIYVPTARLPYLLSFWIWTIIAVLLLAGGLYLIGPSRPGSYLLWAFSFYPVFALFSFGQNSLISFGIFCAVYRLLQNDHRFWAGMVAGLLLFKPQLLLGIGVWWAIDCRRYWPGILGGIVTAVLLAGISFSVVPDETREYIHRFREIAQYDLFWFWNLHTPRAFGTLLSYDNKFVGNLTAGVCAIVAILYFIRFWMQHRNQLPMLYAGVIFLTLWASPHTMIYEWSIVLISAVLLWENVPQARETWLPLFALGWVALFVSTPLTKWQWEWTRSDPTQPGLAVQISVPILAFIAVRVAQRLKCDDAKPAPVQC